MQVDELELARSRYETAYETYRECAQRVAQKIGDGSMPTDEDTANEIAALRELETARQAMFDVLARQAGTKKQPNQK
jgi:hypothetical protein